MRPSPGFAELLDEMAASLGGEGAGWGEATPVLEVCRDSLDLYCLYLVLDGWWPGFELPPQLDLAYATLGDVHHYLVTRMAHASS